MKLQACTSAVGVEPRLQEACATSRTVAGDSCRRRSRKERDQSLKIVVWRDKDTGRGHVGRSSERESRESGGSRVDTGGSRVEDRERRFIGQRGSSRRPWGAGGTGPVALAPASQPPRARVARKRPFGLRAGPPQVAAAA
ncbi:hypothetical protein M430DRAFT_155351 [Amorphotheca resinae ATCC 22711]|jgi:hypothetical protein|uniref:Uncharacterized protein n=1 Tax=Amorphotheca resinae ATCC 22711 TaxID=857342 RepID=A0A2T3BDQ5_AMORE|nr:hypothetical protein M430DRAFT_155351 [Amorphotheca resinae ATCC 22711]PSS27537.1 hypothetical protein M430DRAFT_155351 [Amorphotheca resinae ATCC 22711]